MNPRKVSKRPPEVPTPDQAAALIRSCSRRAPTGQRNAALLGVLWRAGLRIGEALALEPKDLDRAGGMVHVRHGKGDKARTVPMDDGGWALVDRWIATRKALGLGRARRLFCTLKGDPMDDSYVRVLFPRLCKRAGVDRRVTAHALRHSFALELEAEGQPIALISALLGHSGTATTAVYLSRLRAPQAAIDAVRARRWTPYPTAARIPTADAEPTPEPTPGPKSPPAPRPAPVEKPTPKRRASDPRWSVEAFARLRWDPATVRALANDPAALPVLVAVARGIGEAEAGAWIARNRPGASALVDRIAAGTPEACEWDRMRAVLIAAGVEM